MTKLLFALLLAAAAPATASAQDCTTFTGTKQQICTAAVDVRNGLAALRGAEPSSCVLAPVSRRLDILFAELAPATGLFPVDFQTRTSLRVSSGLEITQEELFVGDADSVVFDDDSSGRSAGVCYASDKAGDELRKPLLALSKAMAAYKQPLMIEGAAHLRRLANTWTWIITDGFGQYPWERAFNDLVHRDTLSIYRLPKIEWVLVHPSVGMEVRDFDGWKDVRAQTALFVEPAGFIRYRFNVDDESRSYWGASVLVVITDDTTPAVGGLVRYNTFALGVVRHLKPDSLNERKWAVVATVELLERTQAARKKLRDAQARAAGAGR